MIEDRSIRADDAFEPAERLDLVPFSRERGQFAEWFLPVARKSGH